MSARQTRGNDTVLSGGEAERAEPSSMEPSSDIRSASDEERLRLGVSRTATTAEQMLAESAPGTRASPSMPLTPALSSGINSQPEVLAGRYELLAMVGVGGMGTVYRARDRDLDDEVALKVLRPEVVSSPGMLDRFRRELKLARRVTHRHVARAHDIGEDGGQHFLTMEFIDGESLSQVLLRRDALSCDRMLEIMRGVCQGLEAAHAVGVIHCDLKPENVLIDRAGRAVITDFGIARGVFDAGLRHTLNAVLGTPAYMAPEQVEGSRDLTPAADVYALGVMLYEMFTGVLPWTGSSVFAVAAARLHRDPPDARAVRPDLPEELALVIRRCMARQPGERYARVSELEQALGKVCVDDVRPAAALRATTASPVLVAASPLTSKTVAVLPFRSVGSPDDAYLADGLTEDLIDQLSMTSGLRVRPRGAVKHLADAPGDARELGQQLGVQVVVEGSLRRAGDRLRVTTRLISVADGFQLWARRSDRTPAEVLALSDELAHAIAEALTVDPQPPARVAPTDPRALDAYFRGRFEYHKFNPESLARAVVYLEEARSLAPDDPMILSGYALACTRHWFFGSPGRAEQARLAAERARALAPHRAEPLVGLASYSFFLDDVPRAVGLLRQALALNADIPDAHDMLGKILVESGPVLRGIDHLERAAQLDPAFRANRNNIGRALALEGRLDEAHALLDAMVRDEDSDPARVLQLRLMVWRRDRAGAEAMRGLPLLERTPFARAMVELLTDPDSTVDPITIMKPAFNSPHATWRGRALFHQCRCEFALVREHNDVALDALADAVGVGLFDLSWVDGCPSLAPLRSSPRFAPLRATVAARARAIQDSLTGPISRF